MMKNSLKHIIILIFCFSIAAKAQTNCDQNSKQAEEFYIGGDYENCIQTIEKLFNECSLSSKKEEVALEFLAKSYLQQDNVALAEKTVQRLLKNNPYYELKENSEDEDFEILVNKFHIHPLFSIGVRNTGMFPKLATTKTFTISDNFNYDSRYVTAKTLLLYYVVAEYEFKKTYSINADILGFNMAYSRNLTKNADYRLNIKENLTFFEIPVYLKKYFPIGKNFLTYTTLGVGYLRLLQASAVPTISYFNENNYTSSKAEYGSTETVNMLPLHNQNNYEWLAGLGMGYRFKNLGIFIDGRYTKTFNNITNTANRYANSVLVNNYYYVANSVKLNKYEIGLSLCYTLKSSIKKIK